MIFTREAEEGNFPSKQGNDIRFGNYDTTFCLLIGNNIHVTRDTTETDQRDLYSLYLVKDSIEPLHDKPILPADTLRTFVRTRVVSGIAYY